jgi:NADH dehydrogenase/NADH:ubiquinone oxidoreductase subunit G
LIHKDKNPNTRGVVETAGESKPWNVFVDDVRAGRVTHAIALGGTAPGEPESDVDTLGKLGALVTIASHEGTLTRAATVLLPAASWAEAGGTWVNAKGIRQIADKAIEPQGSSRPGWEIVRDLARGLGLEASWERLKEVRERLPRSRSIPPPAPSGSMPPRASSGSLPPPPPTPGPSSPSGSSGSGST